MPEEKADQIVIIGATEHNLKFYMHLMSLIREQIKNDTFEEWGKTFLERYNEE